MLAGKSALVTGASRGIGRAIAGSLASLGARVYLVARGAHALESAAREIGVGARAIPIDVSDGVAVSRMAELIASETGGAPDIVVNNAGIFDISPAAEVTEKHFRATIDVNLIAPFLVLRAFLPAMLHRGSGHLVTIGSVADRVVFAGNAAYSAAKFGARGLHAVIREETRGTGVRATLISPSSVDTPIWDTVLASGEGNLPARDAMLSTDAVAEAVVFAVTRPASVNMDEMRLSRA